MNKTSLNFANAQLWALPMPQKPLVYTLSALAISSAGLILYFITKSTEWLIVAMLILLIIFLFQIYQDGFHRKLSTDLLHQLAVEILDVGVILFDMHDRSISCGVWSHKNSQTLLCKIYSTNIKYDSIKFAELSIDEKQAIALAIRERAQIFEDSNQTPSLSSVTIAPVVSRIESQCDWRLITPVLDAIDRLEVIAILVIEGKGSCKIDDLSELGLDKAASMLAFQICEVLSIMRRII